MVIVMLTGIALAVVQLQRRELTVRHELQVLQSRHLKLRRDVWQRQVQLGRLLTPDQLQGRAQAMALPMVPQDPATEETTVYER
jgi:hypothetical protein